MSGYPTGLIFRTWKVLQSGELSDVSPKLAIKAEKPLPEFFLEMLGSPAVRALSVAGVAVNDDEFLVYVPSEEGDPLDCVVTNRKLIFFAEREGATKGGGAQELGDKLEARSCLFASVVSITNESPGQPAGIRIERKRGNPLTLELSSETSTAAIRYAAERAGRSWDALQDAQDELTELETALDDPEFSASAAEAEKQTRSGGPVAATVKVKKWIRKPAKDARQQSAPQPEAAVMNPKLPALVHRTWTVLRTGMLEKLSPSMTEKARGRLQDFFLHLSASPAIHLFSSSNIMIGDDEFLVHVSCEEGRYLDIIVTSQKIIFITEKDIGYGPVVRSCRLASIIDVSTSGAGPTRVAIQRRTGVPLNLSLETRLSAEAIKFAVAKDGSQWGTAAEPAETELAELESALTQPEFAAAAQEAQRQSAKPATVSRNLTTTAHEETWGSVFADMAPIFIGFAVFALVLFIAGAPIFQGGRAVIWWLSDDNMSVFYGAAIAGIATAIFWPRRS